MRNRPDLPNEWMVVDRGDLVAVNKPAGVALMPDPAREDTLAARLHKSRPGLRVVPQLDRETSGVSVFVDPDRAGWLAACFEQRRAKRTFVAVVSHPPPRSQSGLTTRVLKRGPGGVLLEVEAAALKPRQVLEELTRWGLVQPPQSFRRHLHLSKLILPDEGGALEFRAPAPASLSAHVAGADLDPEAMVTEAIDRRLWLDRLEGTNAFRLVHGAGDGIPGCYLDHYDGHLVLTVHEGSLQVEESQLVSAIERHAPKSLYIKRRGKTSRKVASESKAHRCPTAPLLGTAAPEPLFVTENQVRYPVWLADGMTTGIFVDQRDNRKRVRAWSKGATVLNLFGYTGAFSVAAAVGGAAEVTTVDNSGPYLERAVFALDSHDLGAVHTAIKTDVFAYLERAAAAGRTYDLIILDPPTFSTTKRSQFGGSAGWKRLLDDVIPLLAPQGRLLASTNHRKLKEARFLSLLRAAAGDGAEVTRLKTPEDFPREPGLGAHLKCAVLQLNKDSNVQT